MSECNLNDGPPNLIDMKMIKKNEKTKKDEGKQTTEVHKESFLANSPFEFIDSTYSKVSKSICKIKITTKKGTIFGTGFFLKFRIAQELFYCLMSNEHVITEDIIKNNSIIYIDYDSLFEFTHIKLNVKERRYIKSFKDVVDITVVEILEKDNISKNYFLFPEIEIEENKLINEKIYIPQYPEGKILKYSQGNIKEINKYKITHTASTERGSSGSPIFLKNSINVIGIHKEGSTDENYGDFIYPAINIIEKDIKEKRNKGKYENGKYIWEDSKYYIGQFKNNLPDGKGIKYYSNGNILYDGNFINGKYEGKGKYIYDDGDYFIGEYKNGLRNGKGILYDKNGNIILEGDYINGKVEGYGRRIWENGEYYEGQWKNDLKNGKGKEYYANRKTKYEGNFINDKYEGNGIGYWEDGIYYNGQWKNGLRNGKGTLYNKEGIILYEGDWIDDKYEGNGKYIWNNGEYYIGQFKNGLSHGKGAIYYPNGKIKREGKWIEDKFDL